MKAQYLFPTSIHRNLNTLNCYAKSPVFFLKITKDNSRHQEPDTKGQSWYLPCTRPALNERAWAPGLVNKVKSLPANANLCKYPQPLVKTGPIPASLATLFRQRQEESALLAYPDPTQIHPAIVYSKNKVKAAPETRLFYRPAPAKEEGRNPRLGKRTRALRLPRKAVDKTPTKSR
jgi:hypothetical protein